MTRALLACLVAAALPAAAAPAVAPPAGPDFSAELPARGVDRSLAASDATTPIAPEDDLGFWPGSSALSPVAVARLARVAAWLREHPHERIAIEGHAGLRGSAREQEELARRRAELVRAHLEGWGIASDRILVLVSGAPGARVELFASDRPLDELAAAAIDHRRAIVAAWTIRGTHMEEEPGLGSRPQRTVITRR